MVPRTWCRAAATRRLSIASVHAPRSSTDDELAWPTAVCKLDGMSRPPEGSLLSNTSPAAGWLTRLVLRLPVEVRSSLRVEPLALIGFTDERKSGNGNQDRIAVAYSTGESPSSSWFLAVVCDGVGGSSHGERAASAAIAHMVLEAMSCRQTSGVEEALKAILERAHDQTAAAFHSKSSTTAVAFFVLGDEAAIGWVGDSRAYEISDGKATLLTSDDTLSGVMARSDSTVRFELSEEFADRLAQAIGGENPVNANVAAWAASSPDARCLLCTDGVWKPLDKTIDTLVDVCRDGSEQMRRMLQMSEWLGGVDNASAVLVPPVHAVQAFLKDPDNGTPAGSIVVHLPGNVQTLLAGYFTKGTGLIQEAKTHSYQPAYPKQPVDRPKTAPAKRKSRAAKGRAKPVRLQAGSQLVIAEEPVDEAPAHTPEAVPSDKSSA